MKIYIKPYKNNIKTEFIRSWKRSPDGCSIFWKCSQGYINVLCQNPHPTIKFNIEHNFKELPFLDTYQISKWLNYHRYLLLMH